MGTVIIIPDADFSENAIETINLNPLNINIDLQGIVTITGENAVNIYYTTNGNTPDTSSNQYNGSFTVQWGTTVKAICTYADESESEVATAKYEYTNNFNWAHGGIGNVGTSSGTASKAASTIGKLLYAVTEVVLSVNDTSAEVIGPYGTANSSLAVKTQWSQGVYESSNRTQTLTIPQGKYFQFCITSNNVNDVLKPVESAALNDYCRKAISYTGTIQTQDPIDEPTQ